MSYSIFFFGTDAKRWQLSWSGFGLEMELIDIKQQLLLQKRLNPNSILSGPITVLDVHVTFYQYVFEGARLATP